MERSLGTATVRPSRDGSVSRARTSGPHPRPSAPPEGSSVYRSSSHGSAAYDTLTTSNAPRSAAPFVTSMSA